MTPSPELGKRDERGGWPSFDRPGGGPAAGGSVAGWSHALAASIDRPRSHVISPDGARLAFFWEREDAADLYVMPTAGGWPARLTFGRGPRPYWFDEAPQWSPDSEWLAYCDEGHAWAVPVRGGLPVKITARTDNGASPHWLPDSRRLVLTYDQDEITYLVLSDREGGWPRPLTQPVGRDSDPQPSPDGRFVAYVHHPLDDLERADIHLVEIDTGVVTPVTATPGRFSRGPRWSADSQKLAYTSQREEFYDLYFYDLASGQENCLVSLKCDLDEPAWSPDGSHLACTINREGAFDLILVDASRGAVSELRRGESFHARPQWLADGRTITFEYDDPITPPDIYSIEVESRRVSQLTFSAPPALNALPMPRPQSVRFPSLDGLEIHAFLYSPPNPNGAGIVWPHGGPTGQHALEFDIWAQYMLSKGYTLLAPNFRGSTGYGRTFERANYHTWGVGDRDDCLAAADFLAAQTGIDLKRLAIFGGSYGGYLVNCCLAGDPHYRFACGLSKYGDCDLVTSWAECERSGREDLHRMLGHPWADRQAYRLGSPIHQAANIRAPLLILHGLLDPYVPPRQSEELVEALRREGKTYEYITYPDEGHGILRKANLIDFYARMERFLDWYLL